MDIALRIGVSLFVMLGVFLFWAGPALFDLYRNGD